LWGSPWCDGKEEGAKGVLTTGKGWQSGDGARLVVSLKGGGGSVLVDEVIRMRRGEAKVWNGGGGSWPSRRCLYRVVEGGERTGGEG
jgi:hypothetical protein